MSHYHNTTNEAPEQLKVFEMHAKKQEIIILDVFKKYGMILSPWKVYSICSSLGINYPITSIRRSITNLQRAGKLIKTSRKVKGVFGRNEYMWRAV